MKVSYLADAAGGTENDSFDHVDEVVRGNSTVVTD